MARRRTQHVQRKRSYAARALSKVRRALRADDCDGAFWAKQWMRAEGLFNFTKLGTQSRVERAIKVCRTRRANT